MRVYWNGLSPRSLGLGVFMPHPLTLSRHSWRRYWIGKRMFDVGFEPWGDPPPFHMPVFIVTHEAREPLPMQGGTTYTFVTDGIEAALELARAAAGDKNVLIQGGANIIRQYLKAALLDEMHISLIPILLGGGVRLFEDLDPEGIELRRTSSIETPGATHLRFSVVK